MSAWPINRMDELCEITSSKRIFRSDYVSEGVPFYRGKEITEKYKGNLDVTTELFITEEKYNEIVHKFGTPKPGDLLLTSVGTLGSVYIVKSSDRFYFKDGNLTWFRNLKSLDSHFLFYWLGSPQGKGELQKCTIGSSQSAFTIVLLKGMMIELPPLPIQKKIASILSAYDDLIENNLRRIKILEEMAQNLYREWFVKFRFPGHEKIEFIDSPLGMIPEGWEIKELQEIVSHFIDYRGKTPKKLGGNWSESGIMALSARNVKAWQLINLNKSKFVDEKMYRKWMKLELQAEDILMTSEAPLGELYFLLDDKKFCLSQRLFAIRACKAIMQPVMLFHTLSSDLTQSILDSRGTGATVKGIRQALLRIIPVLVPPSSIQNAFSQYVIPIHSLLHTLFKENETLRQTRNLLLPKLISGKLDVSELDIDVPEDTA